MEISPRELRTAEIPDAFRGYNRDVVDEFLERAAATIEALQERNRQLTERLQAALVAAEHAEQQALATALPQPPIADEATAPAQAPPPVAPAPVVVPEPAVVLEPAVPSAPEPIAVSPGAAQLPDDLIQRTLLMAQRAADETIAEADQYALRAREDANVVAARTIAEANSEAERITIERRASLQQALSELEMRREALEDGLDLLERFDAEYRARLRASIAADLEALDRRPIVALGERPAIASLTVEGTVPVAREALETPGDSPLHPGAAEVRDDVVVDGARNDDIDVDGFDDDVDGFDDDGDGFDGDGDRGVGDRNEDASMSSAALTDDDGQTDDAGQDVLDDDAFFASLRQAVRDDSPLGPTDDEGGLFPR